MVCEQVQDCIQDKEGASVNSAESEDTGETVDET